MNKIVWKAAPLLAPVPVVMVTCGVPPDRANIITVAWAGIVCSEPPMLSISVRPERFSHGLITRAGEFCVNLPGTAQVHATDICGVISGRDRDKFAETGLTQAPSSSIRTPGIQECPLCLECKVRSSQELGSHTLFLADIVAVQVAADLVNPAGRLMLEHAGLITYAHGQYYALGKALGSFGFAVRRSQSRRPSAPHKR